ncbi:MAG: hypothetical protein OEY86_07515 [Nitrospira sp.]|nr:hypothetical protein [Nitrospira sp.]
MKPSPTIRIRATHFNWCNRTETDYICTVCESIVLGASCLHCERRAQKKAESLRKFLESRANH